MHAAQSQLLILSMAGWVNRGQQNAIEYLLAENRVLREQLGARGDCCLRMRSGVGWGRRQSG
jgi:hypothetical protein